MPYNNAYNQTIAAQLQSLYANHIAHEKAANDNTRQNDVMDPLEGMALRHEEVKGGSGTAAATLHDLGYEQMNGATGSGEPTEINPKRKYTRRTMKVAVPAAMAEPDATAGGADAGRVSAGGVSGGGVSVGGVSGGDDEAAREVGGGVSAGAKKKRARKAKGGGILDTVKDIADTVGSVGKAVAPFAPLLLAAGEPKEAEKSDEPMEEGGAKKKRSARHDVVRQVMKEKGMSLIEASKHVKEHGLYKKGGALLSLASLDEMKPNQDPQMWETGGVPNSKLPEESKYTTGGRNRGSLERRSRPRHQA